MALFPVTPTPSVPYTFTLSRALSRARYASGFERARVVRSRRLYKATVTYPRSSSSDLASILDFLSDDALTASPFSWVDPAPATSVWKGMYVGVGTGAATVFDLPCRGGASGTTTVYVAGTPTGITFGAGTGADGRDRATFAVVPALGALITVDFTGQLEVWARLTDETTVDYVDADKIVLRVGVEEVAT